MRLKSLTVFCLGAALSFGLPIPLAAASTYPLAVKHFIFNGKLVSSPEGIAAKDPSTDKNTTYIPVYYVMQALRAINIQSHWNGTDWDLEIPSTIQPSIDLSNENVGINSKYIQLNGIPIQSTPAVVFPDPASHVDTTYMPIWYVMKVLNNLKIISHWDGTTWSMQGASGNTSNQRITFTYAIPGQHLIVGDPSYAVLKISAKNSSGQPIANRPVTFKIDNANIASIVQSTVTTDQNGNASLEVTPGQEVGITTLHAACNGETGFTSVTTVPLPKSITATPSTSTFIENTSTEPTITFKATYANSIPVVGVVPTRDLWVSTGWNVGTDTEVTNENGEIVDTIVGTGQPGSGSIGESIQTNKAKIKSSIATITAIQGVNSIHSTVNSMPSTITSGHESQVTVTVKDSQNKPVSGLTTDAFRLELPNQSAQINFAPAKAEDQGNGNYVLSFYVGGTDGGYVDPGQQPAKISVNSVEIGTSSVQVQEDAPTTNTPIHDTVKLLCTPYSIGKNSYPLEVLTYQVIDPTGHPVPNIHVFFNSDNPSIAGLVPVTGSAITNSDGKIYADVDTVGPQDFGTVNLTASIDGGSSITTPVSVVSLQSVQLSATSTVIKAGDPTPDVVNILALDANGNPIPNYYLSVEAYTPLECNTAAVLTDANGRAQIPITAGSLPYGIASVGVASVGDTHGTQGKIDIKVLN